MNYIEHFLYPVEDITSVPLGKFIRSHVNVCRSKCGDGISLFVPELQQCLYRVAGRSEVGAYFFTPHFVNGKMSCLISVRPPFQSPHPIGCVSERYFGSAPDLYANGPVIASVTKLIDHGKVSLYSLYDGRLPGSDITPKQDSFLRIEFTGFLPSQPCPYPFVDFGYQLYIPVVNDESRGNIVEGLNQSVLPEVFDFIFRQILLNPVEFKIRKS